MEDDEAMLWFARGYAAARNEIFVVRAKAEPTRPEMSDNAILMGGSRVLARAATKRPRRPLTAAHKAKLSRARKRHFRLKAKAAK